MRNRRCEVRGARCEVRALTTCRSGREAGGSAGSGMPPPLALRTSHFAPCLTASFVEPADAPAGGRGLPATGVQFARRSEEHTSELQPRGLISYAVFCLKK